MDMRGDKTGRQFAGASDDDGIAVEMEAASAGRDQGSAAAGRVALARDHDRSPQAMHRRRDIKKSDDRRNIGAIARDHLADQSEAPQQNECKNTEPGEHQPAQQRTAITKGINIRVGRWHADTSTSDRSPNVPHTAWASKPNLLQAIAALSEREMVLSKREILLRHLARVHRSSMLRACVTSGLVLGSTPARASCQKTWETLNDLENSEDCRSTGGHGNQHVRLRCAQIDGIGTICPTPLHFCGRRRAGFRSQGLRRERSAHTSFVSKM